MTPAEAYERALADAAARAKQTAVYTASHTLCVDRGHRNSANALGRCKRCFEDVRAYVNGETLL